MSMTTSHLYTAAESRALDQRAMEALTVDGFTLMQRAADYAFACILERYAGLQAVSVWCGKGNNAGDAYLVAARAQQYGLTVQVVAAEPVEGLAGDAALAYQQAAACGLTVVTLDAADMNFVARADVVVDGLLGTGFHGEPRGSTALALQLLQPITTPVFSIDVPSGVDASTGAAAPTALYADATASFITQKIGLFTGAGTEHVGDNYFDALGVPEYVYAAADMGIPRQTFDAGQLAALPRNTYKHQRGHVVVVGGARNMPGAVMMAAQAALRVGAGMVTVVTHAAHTNAIVSRTPEVMVVDAEDETVPELLDKASLLVVGPGLGRSAWSEHLYDRVVSGVAADKPLLLDADGLHWLALRGNSSGSNLFITPHAGEAAALLGCSSLQVQADRVASVRALQQQYACAGVLKGAGSLVFDTDQVSLCGHGNPGMATAGMGDVLSGMAGGLMACAATGDAHLLRQCFNQAVLLHSAAADQAAARLGPRSLLATDVIDVIPQLLSEAPLPE